MELDLQPINEDLDLQPIQPSVQEELDLRPISSGLKETLIGLPKGVAKGFLALGEATLGMEAAFTNIIEKRPYLLGGGGYLFKAVVDEPKHIAHVEELTSNVQKAYAKLGVPQSIGGKVTEAVGASAPFIAGSLATLGTGGVPLAATYGFMISGGQAYNRAKKEGATEDQAQLDMALEGSIGAILNATMMPKVLRGMKGAKFSTTNFIRLVKSHAYKLAGGEIKNITPEILNAAIAAGVQGMIQTGGEIVIPGLTRDAWPRTSEGDVDYVAITKLLAASGARSAAVGGLFGLSAATLGGLQGLSEPSNADIDVAISKIRARTDLTPNEKSAFVLDIESLRQPLVATSIEKPGITPTIDTPIGTIIPKIGAVYRAGDSPTEIVGTDVSFQRGKPFQWGGAYEIEAVGEKGKPIPSHKGAERGTFTGKKITRIFYEPEYWIKEVESQKMAEDLPKLQKLFPDAELVRVQRTPDDPDTPIVIPHGEYAKHIIHPITLLTDYETKLNDLITEVKQFQTFRPSQQKEMSRKLAHRFEAAEDIVREESNPRIALAISKAAMKGKLLKQFMPLKEGGITRTWTESDIDPFYSTIRDSDLPIPQKWDAEAVLNKIWMEGNIPAPHEIKSCESIFGKRFTDALLEAQQKLGVTNWQKAMEVVNIPRAILASCDNSAPLRQAFLMLFVDPKNFAKNWARATRALFSDKYSQFRDIQIKTHPRFEYAKTMGLDLSDTYGRAEERFQSQVVTKIPGLGKLIKASQRGWTTFLNGVRMDSFAKICEAWDGTSKTDADYRSLAQFINHATGRGDIKSFRKLMPALNLAFFAPRYRMGQLQVFGDLLTTTNPVRKLVAANLMEAAGVSLLTLTLASMIPGVIVERDPRSSDFGKIKAGNLRINFLGQDQQLIRVASQFLTGELKAAQTGRVYKEYRPEILARYLRSMLSPPAGYAWDLAAGETFLGKSLKFTPESMASGLYERVCPLFAQDCIDAARYQGLGGLAAAAPLAFHGVGTMTYPKTESTELFNLKNQQSQKYFGGNWDNIGPAAQDAIRQMSTLIQQQEAKVKIEKDNFGFWEKIGKEQKASSDYLLKNLPKNVRDEFTESNIPMVALSRTLNSNWFLNEDNYKEYKQLVSKYLNQILPTITQSSLYQQLPITERTKVMTDIMQEITKGIRQYIVNKANISDLSRIKK